MLWERRPVRLTGLELPFLAYLLWEVLTAALSERPGHSLGKVKSEVLALVFLLAYAGQDAAAVRRHLKIFAGAAGLAAALGLLQRLLGFSFTDFRDTGARPAWGENLPPAVLNVFSDWGGRAVGFYSHPITYAEMLLLAGALALGWALARGGARRWGLAGLLAAGIAASGTRGVWLALAATLGLWALITRDKRLWAALGALGLAVGLAIATSPAIRARAAGLVHVTADDSNRIRLGLWDKSLEIIGQHPVKGVGIGNLRILPSELKWGGSPPKMIWTESHNTYLQMAVERGLPGLALFLWLMFAYWKVFWAAARTHPEHNGLLFGFAGLLLAGLTESWTHDSEIMLCLYFLLGSAAVLRQHASQK